MSDHYNRDPKLGPTREDKALIAEALQGMVVDKAKTEAVRHAAKRAGPWKTLGLTVVLLMVIAGSLWLYDNQKFVPPERTPQRVEDELRYGTYLAAQRIDQFVADNGRLPRTATELGYGSSWLSYTLGPEGDWTLTAREGEVTVTLRAADDRRQWLNGADQRVLKN
jgi:hypothetical protein